MAIVGWNSTSSYLQGTTPTSHPRPAALANGVILSVFVRNPTALTAVPFVVYDTANQSDNLQVGRRNDATNLWGVNRSGAGFVTLAFPFTLNSTHWYHCIFRAGQLQDGSDGSPLYVDGVVGSAPGAAAGWELTATTFQTVRIGAGTLGGAGFAGDIAECALWWSAAGLPTIATLANNLGVLFQSPLSQAVKPDMYFPLKTDLIDQGLSPTTLSLVGAVPVTYTTHPPVADPASSMRGGMVVMA